MKAAPLAIAQITDTHLLASEAGTLLGVPTADTCAAVLQQVGSLHPQPDLLLLTGDLSQDESVASYHRLQSLLKPLGIPSYWLPGNHDVLAAMQAGLPAPPLSADKILNAGGWQLLLLNSAVPGKVSGYLSPETLAQLEQNLTAARDRPTLIAFHHPPLPVGAAWIDQSRLQNAAELFSVLDRHPQVRLVISGHVHQDSRQQRGSVCYLTAPSTCVQFKPNCDRFTLDDRSPGFRLLYLYPDGSFETQIQRVPLSLNLNLAATGY